MTHRAEQLLQPRSFVLSGNEEALVLQSSRPETRLTFLNSISGASQNLLPKYVFSFSNESFNLLYNSNVIGEFRQNPEITSRRDTIFHGTTYASNIQLLSPSSKGIILQDYNIFSGNQYAGFGVQTGGTLIYQLPTRNARHIFRSAIYDGGDAEWMRIQESATGTVQVGIGTTSIGANDALSVKGDTRVQGNLYVTGTLSMDNSPFVLLDPSTQRIGASILPEKVPLLNVQNKLDESVIPQSFNFQYLKAQKNVGIGTRFPAQKLHVWGSTVVSERLGIGITNPAARLHISDASATTPSFIVEAKGGGDAGRVLVANNPVPSLLLVGTHNGVGIGTSSVHSTNKLEVGGNVRIHGGITCQSLQFNDKLTAAALEVSNNAHGIIFKTELVTDTSTGAEYPHVQGNYRFDFAAGISVNDVYSYSTGRVRFRTAIEVDGDTILARQPLIKSDMRHKYEILRVESALDKLDKLRGYTYHLGDGRREAGVLAQEVLSVFPEAVSTENADWYAVRYDSLIALLVEGYHELKKKIRLLEMG